MGRVAGAVAPQRTTRGTRPAGTASSVVAVMFVHPLKPKRTPMDHPVNARGAKMRSTDKRLVSRRDIALEILDRLISELEFMATEIAPAQRGTEACNRVHQRINKLVEERAKCRLL